MGGIRLSFLTLGTFFQFNVLAGYHYDNVYEKVETLDENKGEIFYRRWWLFETNGGEKKWANCGTYFSEKGDVMVFPLVKEKIPFNSSLIA